MLSAQGDSKTTGEDILEKTQLPHEFCARHQESHRPAPGLLLPRRVTVHRPLPAQTRASELSGPTARRDHLQPIGRPNPNSYTPLRSFCIDLYDWTLEKQEVESVA